MSGSKSVVRMAGWAVMGMGLVGFVAMQAVAEQPSHGFHHPPGMHKPHKPHPQLNPPPAPKVHKPHKPHPQLNPPPAPKVHKPHKPHPELNPPPAPKEHKPHKPHAAHKPHPSLNPFAPGQ